MFKRILRLPQLCAFYTPLVLIISAVFCAALLHLPVVYAASGYQDYETSIDYTIYRLATEQNDPSAQYLVGRNFLKGKSVKKDINKAIKWFEKAANQNHTKAEYQLGQMYLYGHGVKQSPNQAYYYLSRAAEKNDLDAQYELANYYLRGTPGEEQYKNAVKWLRRAVARDHVRSLYILGKLVYEGKGTESNPTEAIELLSLAVENGLLEANQYLDKIAALHSDQAGLPDNTVAKDLPSANTRLTEAAATIIQSQQEPAPDPHEYYQLGLAALTGERGTRQLDKAAEYFQSAAQANHGKAQYQLAMLYKQGIGVEQNDRLYKMWLEKAANAGVQSAARDLRALNTNTETRPKSQPESEPLEKFASKESANPNDLYILGLNYLSGNGVVKDPIKASQLFLQAAKLNHPRSQYQLGIMYIDGIGLVRDTEEARQWLSKAAGAGVADARDVLDNLLPKEAAATKSDSTQIILAAIPEKKAPEPIIASQPILLSRLEQQAETGDSAAQYTLGINYLHGQDGYKQDIEKARHWLTKAAENNFTQAQIDLGNLYYHGIQIERDYGKSAHWFEQAANSGDAEAQYLLARLFQKGLGVTKDNSLAVMWYRKAANQGHREARKRLGGCRIC
ncbi:tetratricopeptide repeat protein [Kaarinaea lacus]